ncbi:MAG: hypothetical protein Q4A82_04355 [Corynebacterium sp.]|nr:hypothetical protein [Corynebacterium sp.]
MPFASKRFAPLFGVLTLLILVALAGFALSNSKQPPAIGPAAASVELSEPSEPQANAEAATVAEPTTPVAAATPEVQQPAENNENQAVQTPNNAPAPAPAPQIPGLPQVPLPVGIPNIVIPNPPLNYQDLNLNLG